MSVTRAMLDPLGVPVLVRTSLIMLLKHSEYHVKSHKFYINSGQKMTFKTHVTEIQCPALEAPANGSIITCDETKVGSNCTMTCNDGFIVSRGSSIRRCQENGQWDGRDIGCTGT